MTFRFLREIGIAGLAAAGLFFSVHSASASLLFSSPANGVCTFFGGGSCTLQTITPHPAWQPPVGSAVWVSYADTGQPGTVTAPNDSTNFLIQVAETINVGTNSAVLNFKVWADDTAEVFLNGVSIFAPNFTQGTCAIGSIGCEPTEFALFNIPLAANSVNTLAFQVYQVGSGPFGLLYDGTVTEVTPQTTDTGVPEPSALVLAAATLLIVFAFGAMRRRAN